MYSKQLAEQQQ